MTQMVGAQFERAMLRERTKAGLDSDREDGRFWGRRPKLSPQQQAEIQKMVSKGGKTAAVIQKDHLCQIMLTTLCQKILKATGKVGLNERLSSI